MTTSSKWKINVIFHVENCLSYNIWKSGRKSITGKRDNLTWTKINVTSSFKNTFLELRCQFDDFLAFLWGQGGMKSYLQLIVFLTMLKKKIIWMILRAILFWKMACFWANLHYIAHSSTRGLWTLTRAYGLIKGREWLKLMEIVNYGERNPNHVKTLNFDLSARCACAQRARGHVRTENFEML